MARINEKLGMRPAGKRAMMKLPADRALRAKVTSGQCPKCGQRGARLSQTQPDTLWCTWCSHQWPVPA